MVSIADNLQLQKKSESDRGYWKNLKVAWCEPGASNRVGIYDKITDKDYFFDGPQENEGWHTLVFSVPNSNQLISSISRPTWSHPQRTKLQVFNASPPFSQVFNSGCIIGNTIDIAIHSRTGLVAATSVPGEATCHIYDSLTWNMVKKTRWFFDDTTSVTSMSFDPSGEILAAINQRGNVAFLKAVSGEKMSLIPGKDWNRIRWSLSQPLIAISTEEVTRLQVMDAVKLKEIFSEPLSLHTESINWIEWKGEEPLIATCSEDKSIIVTDVRTGKPAVTFEDFHDNGIISIRWDSTYNLLVTASKDGSIKILDFNLGKAIQKVMSKAFGQPVLLILESKGNIYSLDIAESTRIRVLYSLETQNSMITVVCDKSY